MHIILDNIIKTTTGENSHMDLETVCAAVEAFLNNGTLIRLENCCVCTKRRGKIITLYQNFPCKVCSLICARKV
jgi:hypothetical protein